MNAKEMLSQITALLNAKVSLAQMTLENGTIIEAEAFEAGQSVFIVTEDDKVPLPVGDYEIEGGKILSVQEEGIIATIKDGMEDIAQLLDDHSRSFFSQNLISLGRQNQ